MNTFKHTLPALLLLAGMGVASTASASLAAAGRSLAIRPVSMAWSLCASLSGMAGGGAADGVAVAGGVAVGGDIAGVAPVFALASSAASASRASLLPCAAARLYQ